MLDLSPNKEYDYLFCRSMHELTTNANDVADDWELISVTYDGGGYNGLFKRKHPIDTDTVKVKYTTKYLGPLMRVIEAGQKNDQNKLKTYAFKLANHYREDGNDAFAKCIEEKFDPNANIIVCDNVERNGNGRNSNGNNKVVKLDNVVIEAENIIVNNTNKPKFEVGDQVGVYEYEKNSLYKGHNTFIISKVLEPNEIGYYQYEITYSDMYTKYVVGENEIFKTYKKWKW